MSDLPACQSGSQAQCDAWIADDIFTMSGANSTMSASVFSAPLVSVDSAGEGCDPSL